MMEQVEMTKELIINYSAARDNFSAFKTTIIDNLRIQLNGTEHVTEGQQLITNSKLFHFNTDSCGN
jgi:hypothetical protein